MTEGTPARGRPLVPEVVIKPEPRAGTPPSDPGSFKSFWSFSAANDSLLGPRRSEGEGQGSGIHAGECRRVKQGLWPGALTP